MNVRGKRKTLELRLDGLTEEEAIKMKEVISNIIKNRNLKATIDMVHSTNK